MMGSGNETAVGLGEFAGPARPQGDGTSSTAPRAPRETNKPADHCRTLLLDAEPVPSAVHDSVSLSPLSRCG
ncbi:hypothetical protein J2T22_004093 [Pseudarthrobacter defluvii]|uniref:Uncharacterized protein n=1 Tax=Pseudarthrobacter defluvii TaxID=410837 RepID=A0ABT9UMJ9_9MICC|nr:hypothetical protein [Pseudarthrobacter defluvii]